jgi:hypothetical protein
MLAALALLAASAAPAACAPVEGAVTLWSKPQTRWVLAGEMHGTNEIPEAFANLVCLAAASRGPVTVAIEYPADIQPQLDAWLTSDGGKAARTALLSAPFWRRSIQDGRTSIAFLRMLDRLRVMHQAGTVRSVRAFCPPNNEPVAGDYNVAMADRLTKIADAMPGLVMVLVGNFHAINRAMSTPQGSTRPAASLLPADQKVSVDIVGAGGSIWACQMDGCHQYDYPAQASGPSLIAPDTSEDHRYDMVYTLGRPYSAAEPAVPGVADTSPLKTPKIKP